MRTPLLDGIRKVAQHIFITGPPGSGKTYMSERLVKERGMAPEQLIHVDDLRDEKGNYANTSTLRKHLKTLKRPHMIEGARVLGLGTRDLKGHELILLDQPRDVLIQRLVDRGWNEPDGTLRIGEKDRRLTERTVDEFARNLDDFKKRVGYTKTASVLYHGSTVKIDSIEPRNHHGDPNVGDVVFASPYRQMALAYLGRWGDADINQSGYSKDGKQVYTLEEMRPGAFKDVYGKGPGYLYELPADKFARGKTYGGTHEVVSTEVVTPLRRSEIKNVIQALRREPGVTLLPFNPQGKTYSRAVKRMASRASEMQDPRDYLAWVRKTNPDLAGRIEEEIKLIDSPT